VQLALGYRVSLRVNRRAVYTASLVRVRESSRSLGGAFANIMQPVIGVPPTSAAATSILRRKMRTL
jgi:hypothetical protein